MVTIWNYKHRLWVNLPVFSLMVAEEWHRFGLHFPTTDPEQIEKRNCWRNLYTFGARLTRDGTYDLIFYAITALRPALEEEPDYRAKAYHTQGPKLDYFVPIAADWILQAGFLMFRCDVVYPNCGRGGKLWKGPTGFCPERWELWKKRFGEFGNFQQCKLETRNVAKKAQGLMKKIESQKGQAG